MDSWLLIIAVASAAFVLGYATHVVIAWFRSIGTPGPIFITRKDGGRFL